MITIDNAVNLESILKIIYNPLSELSLALDLLCNPEHHPLHKKWADEVLLHLSNKEKITLKKIEKILDGYLNLDLYLNFNKYPFSESDPIGRFLPYIQDKGNWMKGGCDIDGIISFLSYVWETYIKKLVEMHLDKIKEQMEYGQKIVRDSGSGVLLPEVSERVIISGRGQLKIEKWLESRFDASALKYFFLELSIFSFPHLVISDMHEEGVFWLAWEVPFLGDQIVAPGINRISSKAFALSNKSRLRLLLMISKKPMTQKALTVQMGFSKSTISRHINILIESGIIFASGGERNRLLHVNREVLGNFSKELIQWIGDV